MNQDGILALAGNELVLHGMDFDCSVIRHAPERLMAGPLTFNQTLSSIAGSIPVRCSNSFSGGVTGNTTGSEPVIARSNRAWRAIQESSNGKTRVFGPRYERSIRSS